ncbi:hypothetical protein J3R30DRAFT_3782402 [Lentinula aciculospora]|uniref:Uncharacterized protein n=1 Tax=Lentinula aciculospora TaxID=153920 RepID=A0A9W9DJ26_9AGAR|nr:hypothetical protein J3R30DRAFT_3782402 [Lentinula aciculospora]
MLSDPKPKELSQPENEPEDDDENLVPQEYKRATGQSTSLDTRVPFHSLEFRYCELELDARSGNATRLLELIRVSRFLYGSLQKLWTLSKTDAGILGSEEIEVRCCSNEISYGFDLRQVLLEPVRQGATTFKSLIPQSDTDLSDLPSISMAPSIQAPYFHVVVAKYFLGQRSSLSRMNNARLRARKYDSPAHLSPLLAAALDYHLELWGANFTWSLSSLSLFALKRV